MEKKKLIGRERLQEENKKDKKTTKTKMIIVGRN